MDLCILAALQNIFGRTHLFRLMLAWLLMAGATLVRMALGTGSALHLPVMMLGAAAATGETRAGRILQASACMLALYAAAAGFHLLGGDIAAICGAAALTLLLHRRRHPRCQWNIDVELELDGLQARFPALIDTGNRLRDPLTREPVLIVEAGAVPLLAQHMEKMDSRRLHFTSFGVLGSGGEIGCFHPDALRILLPGMPATEAGQCSAAVYHGRIPGRIRALAPPEFADLIARAASNQNIRDRVRRVFYGFFKHKAIHLRPGGADSPGIGLLHRRQRPASPAADPRGGNRHGAQGARRRYKRPLHHD